MVYNFDDPDFSLYSLGALLIGVLRDSSQRTHDTALLYFDFKKELGKDLSFSVYLYVLDWLFILGVISIDERGDIKDAFE